MRTKEEVPVTQSPIIITDDIQNGGFTEDEHF